MEDMKIVNPFLTSPTYAIPKPGKKNDISSAIPLLLSVIILPHQYISYYLYLILYNKFLY